MEEKKDTEPVNLFHQVSILSCNSCGKKIPESSSFCKYWGKKTKFVKLFCDYCGRSNDPSSTFCKHCGEVIN